MTATFKAQLQIFCMHKYNKHTCSYSQKFPGREWFQSHGSLALRKSRDDKLTRDAENISKLLSLFYGFQDKLEDFMPGIDPKLSDAYHGYLMAHARRTVFTPAGWNVPQCTEMFLAYKLCIEKAVMVEFYQSDPRAVL